MKKILYYFHLRLSELCVKIFYPGTSQTPMLLLNSRIKLAMMIWLFAAASVFSQQRIFTDYLVWQKGDTTYCHITRIERTTGNISAIDYLTSANHPVSLRGDYEVSKAKFICINNEFFWEYLPVKAKKPKAYRHLEIEINGKIKIYANRQLTLITKDNGEKIISDEVSRLGGIQRTIRLENGKYLDVKSKTIKKEIVPYLSLCPEFANSFTKKIIKKNIDEAVKAYLGVCK